MEFNRGDTAILMLNYTINGDPLVEDAYQEIELQINRENGSESIKKLLSDGSIEWGTLSYEDDEGHSQTFTGYYCALNQQETFSLSAGRANVQLRILVSDEVGSSAISSFELGQTLSAKVLT